MAGPEDSQEMRIGEVLKRARTRQGVEIREVEERTKIRTKYLRALESEDWDVLPSPAYAKGFLRTYAQLLGLDADAVVDEYRRQVESRLEPDSPLRLAEPVLEGRRRPGEPPQRRLGPLALVGLGLVAAVAIFLVVGLVGGDDEPADRPAAEARRQAQKRERAQRREREQRAEAAQAPAEPTDETVVMRLEINSDVAVCLVSGSGEALIDGQVLSAGTEDQFERESFELRFPSGFDRSQLDLALDGKPAKLPELSGPAAFAIEPGAKPRQLDPPGLDCP
jgi:cytoskeleton protein RodZ